MTTLLVARHGNTFDPGETVLRVGMKTDLPLSASGKDQVASLGEHLKKIYPNLSKIYTSHLRRTIETGRQIIESFERPITLEALACFDEVDYGVDEGKPEKDVLTRIGPEAMRLWETEHIPPQGWCVDTNVVKEQWHDFLNRITQEHPDQTILVVTSQSIARFLPYVLDSEDTTSGDVYKMKTASVSALSYQEGTWHILYWNHTIPEWSPRHEPQLANA